jgi:PadR family transcriptional regulator, regulatory protein PadR
MTDEEREQHGGDPPRPAGVNARIEVRPRNWLVPVILLTLRECTSYGYKLMEQTAKFGFEAMNPGTFYRTLRHMEKDGLCDWRIRRDALEDFLKQSENTANSD